MADQMTTPALGVESTTETARPSLLRELLTTVFAYVELVLTYIGELSILLWQAVREILRGRIDARDLLDQMSSIGVGSVSIALLTNFASGAVLSLYFAPFLNKYGAGSFVGGVVALAISRELAPVLTGVVTAARAGSTIAAELGTMKVSEQIDALRALAVSPVQYLVVPRLVAAITMLPVICALADAMGILGGYIVAVSVDGVPTSVYTTSIQQLLEPSDFYLGMVKTIFFGLILSLVGCHQGLRTRGGATEVGKATTNTVVLSIVFIYIANFFLAYVLFVGTGSK